MKLECAKCDFESVDRHFVEKLFSNERELIQPTSDCEVTFLVMMECNTEGKYTCHDCGSRRGSVNLGGVFS
jgi:hypothetical protein